ncbi:DUF6206 family protein [Chloroflexota bacterium]
MSLLEAERDLLQYFERGLDPQHPESGPIPARVLGYGEISTVFEIQADGLRGRAFKRLPLFETAEEVAPYSQTFEEYNRLLTEEVGLRLPSQDHVWFPRPSGLPVFYIIQPQLAAQSIGHRAIQQLPPGGTYDLVRRIMDEMAKVWTFNQQHKDLKIGLDGQISNWSIGGMETQGGTPGGESLTYLDTSTPLFRVRGVEQLNAELFLRSAPSFLAWILRRLFLQDVLDRYYDFHLVAIDLAANFYKEQRPELIPGVVRVINEVFAGEASHLDVEPITEEEVRSYYREDALIWTSYLFARKVDRFIRVRLMWSEYPYILPEKIDR